MLRVISGTVNQPVRACVVEPVADPRWAELVDSSPDARIFHHPRWLGLLADCYRYPMAAVCLTRPDGQLTAGLPLAMVRSRLTGTRLVSLPFSDVCGPILGGDVGRGEELLSAVEAERRRLGLALEVHAELPSMPAAAPADRFFHHVISLEGDADLVLHRRVKQSKRRGASLARELGVRVRLAVDQQALDAFFGLHVLTRHRIGLPTQPRRFFRGLAPLFKDGLGFVLLAEWNGRAIAGAVYLRHGSTLTYKYGASDPAHLDKRPNDLIHLEGLRIAHETGCSELDLGRTELDNEGLRRFKRQLGADERELMYTIAPPSPQKSVRSVSQLQVELIRRTPPVFGRLLGAAVYRHFG